MSAITNIAYCLLQLLVFFVAVAVLSKLRFLPLMAYLVLVNSFFITWMEGHKVIYYGIAAILLLYPIAYWGLKFYRHKQEERYELGAILARAKPLYIEEENNK